MISQFLEPLQANPTFLKVFASIGLTVSALSICIIITAYASCAYQNLCLDRHSFARSFLVFIVVLFSLAVLIAWGIFMNYIFTGILSLSGAE